MHLPTPYPYEVVLPLFDIVLIFNIYASFCGTTFCKQLHGHCFQVNGIRTFDVLAVEQNHVVSVFTVFVLLSKH